MDGAIAASASLDFREAAASSCVLMLPAPGMSRSMTYFFIVLVLPWNVGKNFFFPHHKAKKSAEDRIAGFFGKVSSFCLAT
ncbi:hypothetical protein LAB1_48010 [Roseibium sp. LAB1]